MTETKWPPSNDRDDWFEQAWRYRDEVIYPQLIGSKGDGSIITIPYVAFAQMGAEQVDPRWLHCGVLAFPPAADRRSFTFVTSGLSNAWDDDRPDAESVSGLGIELRMDTVGDDYWAKDVLLRLAAMQLLIGAGRFTGARLIGDGDRVRVGAETFGRGSAMTSLLATRDRRFELPSGTFEVLRLFAISEAEREYAASHGFESLVIALRGETTYPVNDVLRRSVL